MDIPIVIKENLENITKDINNSVVIKENVKNVKNITKDINNSIVIKENLENITKDINNYVVINENLENITKDINNSVVINENLENINNSVVINENVKNVKNITKDINNSVILDHDIYKIVSWDVGIKNLSYCIMSYDKNIEDGSKFPIYKWDIIDISEFEDACEVVVIVCSHTNKKGKKCNKTATYTVGKEYVCGMHCRGEALRVAIKKKKVKKRPSILNLGKNMFHKLDMIPELVNVNEVVIENQPCMKSPTMKSVQIMLFSYFIMRGVNSISSDIKNIRLISASNKLKNCDPDLIDLTHIKSKYTRRKKLGIVYCELLIKNDTSNLSYFKSNKKKDDLADAMLQGVYHLETKK
jgi:hypothetical protein